MPEGPEIRRAADELAAAVAGRVAVEVFFAFDRLKLFEETLTGRRIEAVECRSKAMLTSFEGGLVLYSHNQLYGDWFVRPPYELLEGTRKLSVALHTRDASALLYSATDVHVLEREALESHPYLARLGPDSLDPEVTAEQVAERLASRSFRGRQLAALLLDQGFLAGLGNYLRSEILHVARLPPARRPKDCSSEELENLARACLEMPRRSYATGGITNDPRRVAGLKRRGLEPEAYRFAVFAREGEPCYECGEVVVRETYGSRRCYRCPRCQPDL